jgi:hypothetical protein
MYWKVSLKIYTILLTNDKNVHRTNKCNTMVVATKSRTISFNTKLGKLYGQ